MLSIIMAFYAEVRLEKGVLFRGIIFQLFPVVPVEIWTRNLRLSKLNGLLNNLCMVYINYNITHFGMYFIIFGFMHYKI